MIKRETKDVGIEIHPRKGVLKKREVSKHQETCSLAGLWRVLESQRATKPGGKINKQNPQITSLTATPSGEAAQTLVSITSK